MTLTSLFSSSVKSASSGTSPLHPKDIRMRKCQEGTSTSLCTIEVKNQAKLAVAIWDSKREEEAPSSSV